MIVFKYILFIHYNGICLRYSPKKQFQIVKKALMAHFHDYEMIKSKIVFLTNNIVLAEIVFLTNNIVLAERFSLVT